MVPVYIALAISITVSWCLSLLLKSWMDEAHYWCDMYKTEALKTSIPLDELRRRYMGENNEPDTTIAPAAGD